jgi:hypothetical protein
MQYATVFFAALATTVLAAPHDSRQTQAGNHDDGIQIVLENAVVHLTTTTTLEGDEKMKLECAVADQGPYTSINIRLGNNIQNKDLRCEAFDENHEPIAGKRGENVR